MANDKTEVERKDGVKYCSMYSGEREYRYDYIIRDSNHGTTRMPRYIAG
jgi:hypothetical protein